MTNEATITIHTYEAPVLVLKHGGELEFNRDLMPEEIAETIIDVLNQLDRHSGANGVIECFIDEDIVMKVSSDGSIQFPQTDLNSVDSFTFWCIKAIEKRRVL